MRGRRARLCAVVGACIVAFGLRAAPAGAATLPTELVECGDTITHSLRLANDLTCADAITIATSDITLDLGGHRLQGDGSAGHLGVHVSGGFAGISGVTVKNGVIARYDRGVRLNHANASTITGVLFVGNNDGVDFINGSDGDLIVSNTFTRGLGSGVFISSGSGNAIESNSFFGNLGGVSVITDSNTITKNIVEGSGGTAISISNAGAHDNQIVSNTVAGNGSLGLNFSDGALNNTVVGNIVKGNDDDGVDLNGGTGNVLQKNTITANNGDGIFVSAAADDSVVDANVVSKNVSDGIEVQAGATGVVIQKNKAEENGSDGIATFENDTIIEGNTANANGFLNGDATTNDDFGILAQAGTSGSNKANQNDADAQCNQTGLCSVPSSIAPPPLLVCGADPGPNAVLHNPLDCSADGLAIATNNAKVDLNGHRVSGGTSSGLSSLKITADGISVKNGVLNESGNGMTLSGSGAKISGILAAGSSFNGLTLKDVSGTSITKSTSVRNAASGMDIRTVAGSSSNNIFTGDTFAANNSAGMLFAKSEIANKVSKNNVLGNGSSGIVLNNVDALTVPSGNAFSGNQVKGNGGAGNPGFFLNNATQNTFTKNVVTGSGFHGFSLSGDMNVVGEPNGSVDNTFSGNVMTGNVGDGMNIAEVSNGNVVKGNTASANGDDGININATALHNVVDANKANENLFDGLNLGGGEDDVSKNVANLNGFENGLADGAGGGIFASGSPPGSGNSAADNDGTDCVPGSLCA